MHGAPEDRTGGGPPCPSEARLPPLPTSPTGRVPLWVLDEATGRAVDPAPWRAWTPPPPRRRRPVARGLLSVVLVVALCLGVGALTGSRPWPWETGTGGGTASGPGDRPTPGHEATPGPLGTPGAAPGTGSHVFSHHQADGVTPVAYDPCRPLHYVVALDGAPHDAAVLVAEAAARLSAATGLQLVADETTDEAWTVDRVPYQPDRYGDRWAPVLVSWATPEQVPELDGTVAGLGGSQALSAGGPLVYVTGAVTLDAGWTAGALGAPGGRDAVRAVLLHEFGHVLGLDHVDAPGELMSPTGDGLTGFGPGDLAGLAELGRGACEPGL